MSKYIETNDPHDVSLKDIVIIGKLLDTKKLTVQQKEAVKSLLKYYCSVPEESEVRNG